MTITNPLVRYSVSKMMMKKTLIGMTFFGLVLFGQAQENTPEIKKKRFTIDNVQISAGGELNTAPLLMSRQDFSKLAPQTTLYPSGPNDDLQMGMMYSWNANSFNIQLGWSPKNENQKSMHRMWRAGLLAQSFQSNLYSSVSETTSRVDTLYQASNGLIYGFIDSTVRFFSNGYYQATMLKADVSHIWSTGLNNRFQLYTGIGMNAGVNISPRTEIYSNRWSSSEVLDTNGQMISTSGTFNSNYDFERETFRNKTGWSTSMYIPLGMDFRVGQKREFLKNLHFFSELRPSLNAVHVPETRTYIFPIVQGSMGMRWCW
jgi:hypothetical protein